MPTLNLEALADRLEPSLRNAFLQATQRIRDRIDTAALARMLDNGDVAGALRVVGLDPADFSQFALTHTDIFNTGGVATVQSIPPLPQPGGFSAVVVWDARNLVAEQWIRNESSRLVQEIVEDQRTSIRTFLESGLAAGNNPRTTALDLVGRIDPRTKQRTGGVIGLHSEQRGWVSRYTADLASNDPAVLRRLLDRNLRDKRFDATVRKAIKEGRAIPAEIQIKMRMAYSNRALKWRADNIARNETMKALGHAQTFAYQQAIDSGKLDVDLITKFAVTAGDERVRFTHREVPKMNPDGRGWNEPYQTPFGPQLHAPYPTEVGCRCWEKVRINFLKGVKRNG